MIYKLRGHERAHGKQVKIDGFEHKKPVRLTLIRKVDNGAATYMYRVNGKDAGSFVCDAPMALPSISGEPEPFKAMVREQRLSQSSFFVTFPLLCALLRDGEEELVHDLLTDENTWLRMISEGATRTFEGWGKDINL